MRTGEPLALVENPRASDGDVQQLRTAFTTAQARLEQVAQELALQRRLAAEFSQDAGAQRRLETAQTSNDLDQLRADLARERQELAFSERNTKRLQELFQAGAIEAKIRGQTNRVQAADRNLNLDRTRGGTDQLPRLQEVRLKLAPLEGERVAAQRRVTGLQAQLKTAESLFRKQSAVWVEAPGPAVVWQVQARRGDSLRPQQPLLRLVNSSSRWVATSVVATSVSEGDLRRLRIGSRARIDLIGADLDLRGQVDLIRSGVGRLSSQNDDPAPLPINRARESRVRVRIDNDVPAPPRKLCFVGYSGRVSPLRLRVLPHQFQVGDLWRSALPPVVLAGLATAATLWLPWRRWSYAVVELVLVAFALRYFLWRATTLNHALAHTSAELIAVFDCDFMPFAGFLERTLGFFADPKVALVQTPQHYFQVEFHSRNLGLGVVMPSDLDYVFRYLQVIRDRSNAVTCCGTSYVVRRSALEAIGGYVTSCLIEDLQTSTKRTSACAGCRATSRFSSGRGSCRSGPASTGSRSAST